MREYLIYFIDRFEYPEEAKTALLDCYDKIAADSRTLTSINEYIHEYAMNIEYDHTAMLVGMTEIALRTGTPWQTAQLLICILLSDELKKKYDAKGISEQIWHDSMLDLKWKLFECHNVYHIWGSFVAHWWHQFFTMNIFAIGRLQYQMKPFGYTYDKNGLSLTPDMKSVWIHIPSCGPLTKALREDSYSRAREFFKDYFGDAPAIFACHSWLLYPDHLEMLPDSSNIVDFIKDFNIIDRGEDTKSGNLWRIFDDAYVLPYNMLPKNNSMRRAYADRLCAGKTVGWGFGFFIR